VRVFDRMLWFNPSDNQGVRFLVDDVRGGTVNVRSGAFAWLLDGAQ
jgi:hypothetical protein